jgi:pimeloyl-ACP methyl ester carboxylesterase
MRHAGKTPPFRGPRGEPIPGSIAEARYLQIGGIDQWVLIRCERASSPPLVLLHGGPGMSETSFFRCCNAALEKAFTVVYWDQRGAGKSYDRKIPTASMTVEQFISDLDELITYVRRRVGTSTVTIFGHSWGSALGVLYAARFPQKVAAYIGSGQFGDCAAAEAASYAYALAEAHRRNNRKALRALRALGPPPYDAGQLLKERTWIQDFDGQLSVKALWNMGRLVLGGPESSITDLPNLLRGFWFSQKLLWPEVARLNLLQLAPRLEMPVFFFLGRRDHWVPAETSVAYFNALTAPSKTLVWFEDSGHEPFVDEPAKFNAAMLDVVRAAAVSQ